VGGFGFAIVAVVILLIVIFLVASAVRIVNEYERGVIFRFIVRWESCTPFDQTDLTKGRDDSSKVVEEALERGYQTLEQGAGRPHLAAAGSPLASGGC
jgi:hypothetical protein